MRLHLLPASSYNIQYKNLYRDFLDRVKLFWVVAIFQMQIAFRYIDFRISNDDEIGLNGSFKIYFNFIIYANSAMNISNRLILNI